MYIYMYMCVCVYIYIIYIYIHICVTRSEGEAANDYQQPCHDPSPPGKEARETGRQPTPRSTPT